VIVNRKSVSFPRLVDGRGTVSHEKPPLQSPA
jgi:hypothetical protein